MEIYGLMAGSYRYWGCWGYKINDNSELLLSLQNLIRGIRPLWPLIKSVNEAPQSPHYIFHAWY